MFVIISILLLVITSLVMLILRLSRPSFGYHWLIAAGGALVTWIVVLLLGITLPVSVQLISWGPRTAYPNSFIMIADQISWPFAVGLGTLILATLLTDVVHGYEMDWSNWASSLVVTALGLIGVFSGNLLTFIIAWTAFDIIGLVILLTQLQSGKSRRRAVWVFFSRLLGSICLLIAGVISVNDNGSFLLERVSPAAITFVVLAAGLRLGSVPVDSPLIENPTSRRSFGTVLSLVSATIVLVFLVRVALALENVELPTNLWVIIFSLTGLVSLLSGGVWILAHDELEGRHAFILGMSAIVIAATLRAQAEASLSWALAIVFSGGLIFLSSVRTKFSMWITLLGLVGISTLPFTPAWNILMLFASPLNLSLVLYLIAMVFMIWGYAHHASQLKLEPSGLERWIKVVYPMGLLLFPMVQISFVWFYLPEIGEVPLMGWILGPLICVLALVGFFWQRRGGKVPQLMANSVNVIFTLGWFYAIVRTIYDYLSRFIHFISKVLEGEGGLLWVLLWIVLFLALSVISIGT